MLMCIVACHRFRGAGGVGGEVFVSPCSGCAPAKGEPCNTSVTVCPTHPPMADIHREKYLLLPCREGNKDAILSSRCIITMRASYAICSGCDCLHVHKMKYVACDIMRARTTYTLYKMSVSVQC